MNLTNPISNFVGGDFAAISKITEANAVTPIASLFEMGFVKFMMTPYFGGFELG